MCRSARAFGLACVVAFAFARCGSGGGGSTPSSPTAQPTRIIALSGNLTFGDLPVGSSTDNTLTIANSGNSPLTVTSLTMPASIASAYSSSWTSGTISAGARQTATIRCSPAAAVSYDGTLTVNADHTSGTNTITVSCAGATSSKVPLTGSVKTTTGVKIDGATVRIADGPNAGRTASCTDGAYQFDNLSVGNANVFATATGFLEQGKGVYINGANTLDFALSVQPSPSPKPPPSPTCCKVCTTGKACGDTCIAKDLTCHITGGCACNGIADTPIPWVDYTPVPLRQLKGR